MNTRAIVLLSIMTVSGCAELRKGWVKADFVEGKMTKTMVCKMTLDKEGDMLAECYDYEKVIEDVLERKCRR